MNITPKKIKYKIKINIEHDSIISINRNRPRTKPVGIKKFKIKEVLLSVPKMNKNRNIYVIKLKNMITCTDLLFSSSNSLINKIEP